MDRWCQAYDSFRHEYQDLASVERELGVEFREKLTQLYEDYYYIMKPHLCPGPV